jgi:hypothetical protein
MRALLICAALALALLGAAADAQPPPPPLPPPLPPCSGAGTPLPNGTCLCDPAFLGPACALLNNRTALRLRSGCDLTAQGWNVWGSHVVYDADSRLWHMVASLYPRNQTFLNIWLFDARIIHATSPNYWGPFCEGAYDVALDHGAEGAWDRSVMNPKLVRDASSGLWLLFYTGSAYAGPWPVAGAPLPPEQGAQASQRIGVAWAPRAGGPYTRLGAPLLQPRPGQWDARILSNPTVAQLRNGSLLMVYKSSNPAGANTTQTQVCLGAARAEHWAGPWVRVRSDPILPCPQHSFLAEDPTLWVDAARPGVAHLVFKDFTGALTHAGYSGAHAVSGDEGATWALAQPPLAYSTTHAWEDGLTRAMHAQERAQVILSPQGAPLAMRLMEATREAAAVSTWRAPSRPGRV